MKKGIFMLMIAGLLTIGIYQWFNQRNVHIIDIHRNAYTAEILVDHLPLTEADSIEWWIKNKRDILTKYNIPEREAGGPDYITFYAYGEGYQEEGTADRLCFDDIKPPKNCIDKDILMTISHNRNGEVRFSFSESIYIETKNGEIKKMAKAP